MMISLKCQYALRALFEFARREGEGLLRVTEIAETQGIPPRFLENILNQLRQGGFVESRRGKEGGFALNHPARDIRVGDIIRFIEGPLHPVNSKADTPGSSAEFNGMRAFAALWNAAEDALATVYDGQSLQDLVETERRLDQNSGGDYCI